MGLSMERLFVENTGTARIWSVRVFILGEDQLWKRSKDDLSQVNHTDGRRFVHVLDTFDVIQEFHSNLSHLAADTTHGYVMLNGFGNISRREVVAFCRTCAGCCGLRPEQNNHKGAITYIKSHHYRCRWVFDLVSYADTPAPNISLVMMYYLLVIKDHFARILMLWALPGKDAKYVKEAFEYLTNLMGLPLILHSDNGGEFKGDFLSWVGELQKCNEHYVFIITGAARTPRHQGSVERANQDIKNLITARISDLKMRQPDPTLRDRITWVTEYAYVMGSINSATKSRRKEDKYSPYENVFGMPFKPDVYRGLTNRHPAGGSP